MSAMPTSPLTPSQIRSEFPLVANEHSPPLIYLDTGATAQKPQAVIDKVVECYSRFNANVHRGVHPLHERVTGELEAARKKFAAFLNCRPLDELDQLDEVSEILFTAGTTMGINLVAHGWGRKFLQPGDEILLNPLEHHANIVPWQMAAQATGAKIVWAPLTPDGRIELETFTNCLTQRTKLVAITAMSNVLGTLPPIPAIVQAAHAVGAVVLVDAAQSAPHAPIDVQAWDADFVVFSGHKLYGPTGVGVLYGKLELLEAMDPFLGGGNMIDEVFADHSTYKRPPFKFEAGTLPIAQAIGLGTAVDCLTAWGWETIHQYEQALLAACHARLEAIPGVTIYGPRPEHKGAIVSFTVNGIPAHDLGTGLAQRGIAVRASHHCAKPLHQWLGVDATTRASFAIYNTLEEVEALGRAIEETQRIFRRESR